MTPAAIGYSPPVFPAACASGVVAGFLPGTKTQYLADGPDPAGRNRHLDTAKDFAISSLSWRLCVRLFCLARLSSSPESA